jgi:hypothetical protein
MPAIATDQSNPPVGAGHARDFYQPAICSMSTDRRGLSEYHVLQLRS